MTFLGLPSLSLALFLMSTTQGYVIKAIHHERGLRTYETGPSNLTAEHFLQSREPVAFHHDVERQSIGERQCFATTITWSYSLHGDSSPHQNYKIAQIEDTEVICPATVTTGHSHTFSWTIGGGFNPGPGKYDFFNAGFTVGESDTKIVTDSFDCSGDMTEICALHYTAVTAITVDFYSTAINCLEKNTKYQGTGVVYLPNANGVGSGVGRGVNFGNKNIIQCRGQAAREVELLCGPRGGPEWFDTHAIGPWTDDYMAAIDPVGCDIPIEARRLL